MYHIQTIYVRMVYIFSTNVYHITVLCLCFMCFGFRCHWGCKKKLPAIILARLFSVFFEKTWNQISQFATWCTAWYKQQHKLYSLLFQTFGAPWAHVCQILKARIPMFFQPAFAASRQRRPKKRKYLAKILSIIVEAWHRMPIRFKYPKKDSSLKHAINFKQLRRVLFTSRPVWSA